MFKFEVLITPYKSSDAFDVIDDQNLLVHCTEGRLPSYTISKHFLVFEG